MIQLDKRSLRTPTRHLLAIPSLPLALAIAAEWQSQVQYFLRESHLILCALEDRRCPTLANIVPKYLSSRFVCADREDPAIYNASDVLGSHRHR